MAAVFRAIGEPTERSLVLETILMIGYNHSRFYVRDVFVGLMLEASRTEYGAMQIAEILRRAELDVVRFVEPFTRNSSLPASDTSRARSLAGPIKATGCRHMRRILTPGGIGGSSAYGKADIHQNS